MPNPPSSTAYKLPTFSPLEATMTRQEDEARQFVRDLSAGAVEVADVKSLIADIADNFAVKPVEVDLAPTGASIATASGTYVLAFEQHPDGLWRSTESVPVQTAGRITLRALVKAGTATVIDSTESIISAISRPYLMVENPTAANWR